MIYGALPEDCGLIDIRPVEMMCWVYCPVSAPGMAFRLPDNLRQFLPVLTAVWEREPTRCLEQYIYLTAKRRWVEGADIGNRPGWHSDGFGTDDLNFIWYDRAPTDFITGSFELPEDCSDAMAVMTDYANGRPMFHYPDKHLLRLDPRVIHRPPVTFEPGMRSFLKVSISKDRYNLEGNSVNHLMPENWPLMPRHAERNHPTRLSPETPA